MIQFCWWLASIRTCSRRSTLPTTSPFSLFVSRHEAKFTVTAAVKGAGREGAKRGEIKNMNINTMKAVNLNRSRYTQIEVYKGITGLGPPEAPLVYFTSKRLPA